MRFSLEIMQKRKLLDYNVRAEFLSYFQYNSVLKTTSEDWK